MNSRLAVLRWRPSAARRDLLLLALAALVVLGAGFGLREPWPADEPRFALAAYDMVRSGDWFFPRIAGELYPDKPPVFMWLIAFFYMVTGSLRAAFLLPSLLAGFGTLALVYDLGRRLWHHRIGLIAGWALLVTVQFALQARTAQIDALVTFFITLGLYGILRHLLLGPAWGWYALGAFAAGVGVITKGVGFIALLVLLPWAFAAWRGWPRVQQRDLRLALAPLLLLVAVALWLVPMLLLANGNDDPAFAAYRDNILFHQTGDRYAAAWHHHNPPWYYLTEVIPPFWLPLCLLLPWLVPAWRRRLRRRDARYLLPLGYALLVLLFFSASPGKRGVYILPMLPMVVLAAAPLLPGLLRRAGVQLTGAVVLALITVALLVFPSLPQYHLLAADNDLDAAGFFYALGGAGLAWGAWAAWRGLTRHGMHALAGFCASLWVLYGVIGYPLLDGLRSSSDFTAQVRAVLPTASALAIVAWDEEVVLQIGRPFTHFGFRRYGKRGEPEDALRWLVAGGERRVLLPAPDDEACIIRARAVDLGEHSRRHWLLIGSDALTDDCHAKVVRQGPPPHVVDWAPGPERSIR